MAEKLRHPGWFRRVFLTERPHHSEMARLQELKAVRKTLHLRQPLKIFYPACGTDISVSRAFSRSHIYYLDTNHVTCEALKNAKLPRRKTTITEGSVLEVANRPSDVDLVILRNAGIDGGGNSDETLESLVSPLKKGGYVIAHAWGTSSTASELLARDDMQLTGYLLQKGDKQVLVQDKDTLSKVTNNLNAQKDSLTGAYPGRTFVFQKKK